MLSATGTTIPANRPYAVHYNGRRWRQVPFPLTSGQGVSAVSAADIWHLGDLPQHHVLAQGLAHWDGTSWRTHALPTLRLPPQYDGYSAFDVVALSPRNVWVAANLTVGLYALGPGILLHWNGGRWQLVNVPYPTQYIDGLIQDGHGGLWVSGTSTKKTHFTPYFYHDSNGHWSKQRVPTKLHCFQAVMDLSWIPGTQGALAVEDLDSRTGNTLSLVLRHGR